MCSLVLSYSSAKFVDKNLFPLGELLLFLYIIKPNYTITLLLIYWFNVIVFI